MEVPEIPAPVAVSLDPARSAILALDMSDLLCEPVASCRETVPRVRALLDLARAAGVRVIFSCGRAPQNVLAELGSRPDEAVVRTSADKFFETDLAERLVGRDIAVLVGTNANGSVLYTALAACARGLTVVVAEDAISSRHPFGVFLTRWQLLIQPGFPNVENRPLAPRAVTLTRCSLITFV